MMRQLSVLSAFFLLLNTACLIPEAEAQELSDEERIEWWSDARFGMFIHWGLYAQDGCFWNGQNGRSEHMMRNLEIPISEYEKIATEFNPEKFNAEKWVQIAKDAGMKYMVITSKHHDGFAMFDSPSSDYDIVETTPWKHDPIKELNAACKKQGLKFGVYYSLGRDWHDPDCNSNGGRRSNTWDYPDEDSKDYSKYFERKVKSQITELMNQYQPAIIWFDTPEKITEDESKELLDLIHQIDPSCIVNSRIGNKLGDYAVKEQKIPTVGEPKPWETCMTISKVWGYHKEDDYWKSSDSLVRNLVDIASKGGNLLLNVGPTGEGIIREPSVILLQEMGEWLKVNGEAIYETTSSPFGKFSWGRCTKKVHENSTTLYFTIFDWPNDKKLFIPQLVNRVVEAKLLANNKSIKTSPSANGLTIKIPKKAPDTIASVVKVEIEGSVSIKQQ